MARQIKCPLCDHTMSELRDLCPECLTDLRPAKKKAGIVVSFPEATYEELLGKVIKKPLANPVAKAVEGILSTLSSFLGSPPNPIARRSLELEKITQESTPPRESFLQQAAHTDPPTPIMEALEPPDAPPSETPENPVMQQVETPEAVPDLPKQIFAPDTLLTREANIDNLPPPPIIATDAPTMQMPQQPEPFLAIDPNSPQEMFSAAMREFLEHPNGMQAELTLSAFQPLPKTEEVELLFELSDESFLNPAVDDRYSDQIFRGDTPTVRSDFLREELEKAERALNPASLSLREMQRLRSARERRGHTSPHERGVLHARPATIGARVDAWIVDFSVTLLLALLSSALLVDVAHPGWWSGVLNGNFTQIHALSFLATLLASTLILNLLYPFLSVLASGTTIGREYRGIAFRSSRGNRCTRVQIALRGLSFPVFFVLGGWICLLLRKAQLSDILTDSFPITVREDQESVDDATNSTPPSIIQLSNEPE